MDNSRIGTSFASPGSLFSDKPRLLGQVRAAIHVRHYSLRTETAYVHWIKRFILFHDKRHPAQMGASEVEAFLSDLAVRLLSTNRFVRFCSQ